MNLPEKNFTLTLKWLMFVRQAKMNLLPAEWAVFPAEAAGAVAVTAVPIAATVVQTAPAVDVTKL